MTAGVLLMAYGSPATLADVEAYFTHIRGGRSPAPAQVQELRARYQRIGGMSPLREITRAQADALQRALAADGAAEIPVHVGLKHAPPFIEDAVSALSGAGVRRAVGLALAPHYSRLSIASYFSTAAEAAQRRRIVLRTVESWYDHPGFVAAVARRVLDALRRIEPERGGEVIFTAHSLPQRILSWNDPYPEQLRRTCALVAARAGLTRWQFAYQSASRTEEPWLGPDLLEVIADLAAAGRNALVVCPVGFVADHLEVLYDIDVEATEHARRLGVRIERVASLNDGADFVAALSDIVRAALREVPV